MTLTEMTLLMLAGHFLADYPLQGDFLARAKNHRAPVPGMPWFQALIAHSAVHAMLVGLITGSAVLGVLELIVHAIIDYAKCDDRISFNMDQALHLASKFVWVFLILLSPELFAGH